MEALLGGASSFIRGIASALFGGIGSGLMGKYNSSEHDRQLAEQDALFDKRMSESGIQRERAISGIQGLIDRNQGRNPVDIIKNFTNSYEESPYNQYLKNQSIASTENIVKDQNLLGSELGRQSIQNTAATAANSGLKSYIDTGIGLQNNINNIDASLELGKAGVLSNNANSIITSAQNAYNTNVTGINNAYNATVGKPNIFDKIANTGVEDVLKNVFSDNKTTTERNQSIGVR